MRKQTPQTPQANQKPPRRFDLYKHLGVERYHEPEDFSFPNFDLLTPEETKEWEERIHDNFTIYYQKLQSKTVMLLNKQEKIVYTHPASDNSRYSSKGKRKKQREMRRRFGAYKATRGLHVIPTFAAFNGTQTCFKHVSRLEAWKNVGKWTSEFFDRVNKLRSRRGCKKRLKYARVPEPQPVSRYPHNHAIVPGIMWLGHFKELQALWPYGTLKIKEYYNETMANYLTKYISKMDGSELMNEMLFAFHLRMFSMSAGWGFPKLPKKRPKWIFHATGTQMGLEYEVHEFMKLGFTEQGQIFTEPRGP